MSSSRAAIARIHILCREGERYGVHLGDPNESAVDPEERGLSQHLFDLVKSWHDNILLTTGPLEIPVFPYLSSVDKGTLSGHLSRLPTITGESAPLALEARGRYQVLAVQKVGRSGLYPRLLLRDRRIHEREGLVTTDHVMLRMIEAPGISLVIVQETEIFPVVLRLTSHSENCQENDLVTLPECKSH